MKLKVVLMLALGLTCSSAMAGWIKVNYNERVTSYVDPSTIRKNGSMVKMWSLLDLKTSIVTNGNEYSSIISRDEYDCKEEKSRLLSLTMYAGKMGQGEVVHTESSIDAWQEVVPNSTASIKWKRACGKQ